MENVSKALQIAGGVLIALIILSLVVYAFKQFGILPQQEAESMSTEQLAKFNSEFEVYNKSRMYGVDVISCLNKVQNYNDKYVLEANDGQQTSGGFYVGTSKIGREFRIEIEVKVETPLVEELKVTKIDENTGRSVQVFEPSKITDDRTLSGLGFKFPSLADRQYRDYTSFSPNDHFNDAFARITSNGGELNDPNQHLVSRSDGQYYKLSDESKAHSGALMNLLAFRDRDMKQIVVNDGKTDGHPVTEWNQIIWYTALNDFKTRQFRCDRIDKNPDTGQINLISFSEIANARKSRN